MAYIVSRTTKAGTISTALVQSYRDEHGRPRRRILANMHGEPDTLRALAKLAVMRSRLSKEWDELIAQHTEAYASYSPEEFRETARIRRKLNRLSRRLAQ